MEKFIPYFWILFGVFTIVHMVFCFFLMEKARKISKCFIMPLLIFYMIMIKSENILVYLGAICGFLGDVLIIFKKKHILWFVIGTAMFLLGHGFYVAQMYINMGGFQAWHLIAYGIIFLLLCILGYNVIYPKVGKLVIVGIVYFTFLISAVFVAITSGNKLAIFGTFMFMISDVILSFTNFFKENVKRKELYVMSTYILAQLLMILALA